MPRVTSKGSSGSFGMDFGPNRADVVFDRSSPSRPSPIRRGGVLGGAHLKNEVPEAKGSPAPEPDAGADDQVPEEEGRSGES